MKKWFTELDDLLRGRKSQLDQLGQGTGHIPIRTFVVLIVALGVLYGAFMGLYSILNPPLDHPHAWYWQPQLLASVVKVPLLFFLTLLVTFPSLYVFSALLGVRTTVCDMLRLMIAAVTVNMAVLASLGFITAFFTLTTTSYPFMKLLNVFCFTVAGFISLSFLSGLMKRLEAAQWAAKVAEVPPTAPVQTPPAAPPVVAPAMQPASALAQTLTSGGPVPPGSVMPPALPRPIVRPSPAGGRTSTVFQLWMVIYALVGAQMSWVLRPFIGSPSLEFTWFRHIHANFFVDVFKAIGHLFE